MEEFSPLLIQSSSALTALVINLGRSQLIQLNGAVAMILGGNLGTCFTGVIAGFSVSPKARLIVLGQILFNLIGVSLVFVFLQPFSWLIEEITASTLIERKIANAHTVFNIIFFFNNHAVL